ncbi:MAG: 2-dehydropantoate 2-reductase [Burkholderiaceae bacterium]|nr:2-dehydropantoate 2-reductase [Burkholderiaceae bacterium]
MTSSNSNSSVTRVAIVGVGAIGGYVGTRLALLPDVRVSALARGATLAALREHGLRLRQGGELIAAPVQASDDAAALGQQDIVLIAVKGPALATVAAQIAPLLGPQTRVVPAMNGVPWWFGAAAPGLGSQPLDAVDPGGHIAAAIDFDRVLGCVVHASCFTEAPGIAAHKMGSGLIVGEPLGTPPGGESPRAQELVALLRRADFDATLSANVRQDIWYKLWGNMTMNPITALTGATVDRVLDDPLTRGLCTAAMAEAQSVGAAIGCAIAQTPEDRHQITRKLGAFKTSMLQDVEAGRAIELDALVTVVHEIAGRVGIATPFISALLGLARLHGRVHGLYPEAGEPRTASAQGLPAAVHSAASQPDPLLRR